MHYKNNGLSEESKINHDSIEKEFGLLSAKWRVYCDLFQNQKGANTLWEASELIYSVFIESLRDDFVITISRLTDNANTGKNGENKNSTLYRLRDDLKQLLKQRLREGYYNESLFVQKSRKS